MMLNILRDRSKRCCCNDGLLFWIELFFKKERKVLRVKLRGNIVEKKSGHCLNLLLEKFVQLEYDVYNGYSFLTAGSKCVEISVFAGKVPIIPVTVPSNPSKGAAAANSFIIS